ncbi:MAG: ATP-binding cassette domain-containing protein [Pseudomonadota bacterium]
MADRPDAVTVGALSMRDVAFRYAGTGFALTVPHYALDTAEAAFLRGPSGSGKTTLLGLATGLLAANAGTIDVAGQTMPDRAAARDRLRADAIGVIHQQFNLLPYLDTLTNVLLPTAFGRDAADPTDRAVHLLTRLGIPNALHHAPARALSVGQQQRVAVARALIGSPRLIVADEPTSALDAEARDTFLDLLFERAETAGAALLMVSHDPAIGRRFARADDLRDVARIETRDHAP